MEGNSLTLPIDVRYSSNQPWLYDSDGRQVTPSVDDQIVENGWPEDNTARRKAAESVINDPLLEDVSGINLLVPRWTVTGPARWDLDNPKYDMLKDLVTGKLKLKDQTGQNATQSTARGRPPKPKQSI